MNLEDLLDDQILCKKFDVYETNDAIFFHKKDSDYWKVYKHGGMFCLLAWNMRYRYQVYFDDLSNLVDFVNK